MPIRTMTAKYAGTCRRCGEAFAAGTQILFGGRGRTFHAQACTHAPARPQTHRERFGRCEDAPCCGCC